MNKTFLINANEYSIKSNRFKTIALTTTIETRNIGKYLLKGNFLSNNYKQILWIFWYFLAFITSIAQFSREYFRIFRCLYIKILKGLAFLFKPENFMNVEGNMTTCGPIVLQDVNSGHISGYNRVGYLRLHGAVKRYVSALNNTITKLEEMFGPIAKFRTKTNIGRTFATVTGVAGTSLAVGGVIFALPTFGEL